MSIYPINVFLDFYNFLKNPIIVKAEIENKNKVYHLITLLIMMLFFVYFSSIIIKIFVYIIDFNEACKIYAHQSNKLNKYTIFDNISYILIIGPLIEEFISRLFLDLKKRNVLISLLCILAILIKSNYKNLNSTTVYQSIIIIILIIFISLARQKIISLYGNKFFVIIFYFSCLMFASLHFSNFYGVLNNKHYWILPILVIPQFIMGIFFGYTRLKFGFLYGVLFHVIMNIPAVLIYLTTKLL